VKRTYASQVSYDELGGLRQERFGTDTPVYNKRLYNSRGQLAEIRVSTHSINAPGQETNWNRGAIINHYSDAAGAWGATGGGPDNNGNLRRHSVYVPTDDQISGYWNANQFYEYDSLNRLDRVQEEQGGTVRWAQDFDYDRWGNRTINAAGTWGQAPEPQFTVDAVTNRLGVPAGQAGQMSYDPAGNLTFDSYRGGDGGGGSRVYDAENRMTSAQFVSGQTQTASYTYDADGRRVKRKPGAGSEVWQVYGPGGELLAEYAAGAQPPQPQKEYGYRSGALLVTAEPAPAAPLASAPTSGLVAHWALDEGAGAIAADSSGNGNTGTLQNGPVWAAGKVGTSALDFDGADDRLTTANPSTVSDNFTIAFWADPDVAHEIDPEMTYSTYGGSGQRYAWWPMWRPGGDAGAGVSVGTNGVSAYEHGPNFAAPMLVHQGQVSGWTHVAVVYESKRPKLYINGALVRTGLQSPRDAVRAVAQDVGGNVYGYYDGSMDDVRLYNRALSAGEVSQLAAAGGASSTGATASLSIQWIVSDQLGTPRMVLDKTGSLAGVTRHDYFPFGEEIGAGVGGRTTNQGYSVNDSVRQKFTSKERDDETGLDYFGARYYSSAQGRSTSVDPENCQARQDLSNPQSWNAYSYVNNNPLRYIDPDGNALDDPSYWQQLKEVWHNGTTYGYWMTNAELHAAATAARTQVAVEFGIVDGEGNYHPIDLSRKSDAEALQIRDELVTLREAGQIQNMGDRIPEGPAMQPPVGLGELKNLTGTQTLRILGIPKLIPI
jgi:RHS repeat-associated protein